MGREPQMANAIEFLFSVTKDVLPTLVPTTYLPTYLVTYYLPT